MPKKLQVLQGPGNKHRDLPVGAGRSLQPDHWVGGWRDFGLYTTMDETGKGKRLNRKIK